MLDAVIDYLPAPSDLPPVEGTLQDGETPAFRKPEKDEPFSALAFKIAAHPFFGKLTYIRVYSGRVAAGSQVINSTKDRKERIGKIFQMHANKENPVDEALVGHIYAVIGLKDTTTGETLVRPAGADRARVHDLPGPGHPGRGRAEDQGRPGEAVASRSSGSPRRTRRSRSHLDDETGQTILAGMGELHLEVLVNRMKSDYKVEANIGKPQVAYRETITKTVEKYEYTHKKQTGGSGQFARVIIKLEPLDTARRRAVRVREQGHRWPHPAGVHPVGRRRCPGRHAVRRARGLPAHRDQAHAARRCLPRGRLVGDGVQGRRFDGAQGGRAARPARCCSSR